MNDSILVICGKVVLKNSKIDWPDLNYPGSGQTITILRTIHQIDYSLFKFQLDGENGPWFDSSNFPKSVNFYKPVA
jgi:hypothetical protein